MNVSQNYLNQRRKLASHEQQKLKETVVSVWDSLTVGELVVGVLHLVREEDPKIQSKLTPLDELMSILSETSPEQVEAFMEETMEFILENLENKLSSITEDDRVSIRSVFGESLEENLSDMAPDFSEDERLAFFLNRLISLVKHNVVATDDFSSSSESRGEMF